MDPKEAEQERAALEYMSRRLRGELSASDPVAAFQDVDEVELTRLGKVYPESKIIQNELERRRLLLETSGGRSRGSMGRPKPSVAASVFGAEPE